MTGTPPTKAAWWRRWRWPLAAAVLIAALATGVAALRPAAPPGAGPTAGQGAAATTDSRAITTLDGATVAVPVAGKPTAAYFFATGCGSCVPPLKALATAAKAHPTVVYLPVSISPYDDADSVRGFLAYADDSGRRAALDPQARLATTLNVNAQGTLVVYNSAGAEVYRGVDPPAKVVKNAFAKAAAS